MSKLIKLKNAFDFSLRITKLKIYFTETFLLPFTLLWARIFIGCIFWKSGQTKVDNIDNTIQLFEWEYIPNWEKHSKNIFGFDLSWTVPDPAIAAKLSLFGELVFPVLLIAGLFARVSAIGLLFMTLTIDLFVYPEAIEHAGWMTILLLLITIGPGKISIDYFLSKKFLQK